MPYPARPERGFEKKRTGLKGKVAPAGFLNDKALGNKAEAWRNHSRTNKSKAKQGGTGHCSGIKLVDWSTRSKNVVKEGRVT